MSRWLFAALLPVSCELCSIPQRPDICRRPWCVTTVGDMRPCTLDDDDEIVGPDLRAVTWPECPLLHGDTLRRHGHDLVTAPELAMLAYEAGALRDLGTSASETSLILSWLRDREYPARLAEARRIEQRRREQG